MRAATLATLLLTACAHAPPQPAADAVACVAPLVGLALAADLVGPLLQGERNGKITVDARGCGAAVLSDADAGRLSALIPGSVQVAVALVKLSDNPCADVWATAIGTAAEDIGRTLPQALAQRGPVTVEWSAPECKP